MKITAQLLVAAVLTLVASGAPASTTIIVDTTEDLTNSLNHTCTYTQGGLFFPALDGMCTFRRAIVEASARPQADRPITILFTGLDAGDPNYDPGYGTFTFPVNWSLPPLKTDSILNLNGQVHIDGPALSPQTGGPRIFIDTEWSLAVQSESNEIRRIAFKGGGGLQISEGDNLVELVAIGLTESGQEIALENPGDPFQLAGSGIHISADNVTIRNSVIAGAFNRAIDINSGTSSNTVQGCYIGTRMDGTVPIVPAPIECLRSLTYDPSNWYGGWGIALAGTGHTISDNVVAGLHIIQSANDTPPTAIEIFGADHLVSGNIIGEDSAHTRVGVCGQGIKVAGSGTQIVANTLIRSRPGFESSPGNSIPTAILASDSSPTFGEISVQGNVVIDGPGTIYEFGPGVPFLLRTFVPAEITSIDGLQVTGGAAPGYPCGSCRIDFYLDDTDAVEEAMEHLGSTMANSSGDFTFTLSAPLAPGAGIRTMSTTAFSGTIGSYGPGTSTEASQTLYQPAVTSSVFGDGFESGDTAAWSSVVP